MSDDQPKMHNAMATCADVDRYIKRLLDEQDAALAVIARLRAAESRALPDGQVRIDGEVWQVQPLVPRAGLPPEKGTVMLTWVDRLAPDPQGGPHE